MNRSLGKRGKPIASSRVKLWSISALVVAAVILHIAATTSVLGTPARQAGKESDPHSLSCVAWRSTRSCTPYGVRNPRGDKKCRAWIPSSAGYCECENFVTTKRLECGFRLDTCEKACRQLGSDPGTSDAQALPANVSCRGSRSFSELGGTEKALAEHAELDAQAARLWAVIKAKMDAVGHKLIVLPESRTRVFDWVRDGVRIPREDTRAAKHQWRAFLANAPEYPATQFRGKGVVILAGGLTYMVPAWVNIQMLRKTGCSLPVDMFFPASEFPTPALERALRGLGVTCRSLPDSPAVRNRTTEASDQGLSGFTMKVAALILSQFSEVIFLDSDNLAVTDPSILFSHEDYQSTGALLWPDYWHSSAAPDLADILDVDSLPTSTFESGQMVFDKRRTWRALLLAVFFNTESHFYYELFSNFMGKGDKESFAHALHAVHQPFGTVRHPVGSVGERRRSCQPSGPCETAFLGNTMTQYSPDGHILFLHTNLSPKWNLEIPGNFSDYRRRWKTIVPGNEDFLRELGDLELVVYNILVEFSCADFLPSYIQVLSSRMVSSRKDHATVGLSAGLQGFHPLNPGIDFRHAFRWGLSGPYLEFTQVSAFDRLQHFCNTAVRSRLGFLMRILLRVFNALPWRSTYFTLW